jgi:carbamoyl-phosphate synthase large subunit
MITLLITGVGGPLGQALIKAARASVLPCRIVGTDRSALSIGFDWVEHAEVIADSAESKRYVSEIARICAEQDVDLVLPGSDNELALLSAQAAALRASANTIVVAASPDVLRVGLDKWETCLFLEANGLRFPRTARVQDEAAVERLVAEFGFPLIAKPRRGSGSRGVCKIRSVEDLQHLRSCDGETVLQEYLQPDDQEYTVAVYTQRDQRQAGAICMRRELVAGNTYRAWVDQNEAVLAEAEAVVRALQPVGPCNVQLRLTSRGAVTFEINPRFSGTTAMRAHFGYNEVEMAIRDLVLREAVPRPSVRAGTALRFWDEIYLDGDGKPEPRRRTKRGAAMRALRPEQTDEWMHVIGEMTRHDFYYLPAYHALAERRGEGEARLFVYENDGYTVALPLVLRPIAALPELGASAGTWKDAVSVYGYAGPLASHEHAPEAFIAGFHEALTETLRELQVVSVFSRLHPLIEQCWLVSGLGECRPGGQTVSLDLTQPLEDQWAHYSATVRTRVRRLQRAGAVGHVDVEKRHLPDFIDIYHETMRRVGAHNTYFFEKEYFTSLAESLGAVLQLFVVKMPNDEVIGGGLFTLRDRIVQYHLGGTRDAALSLSPMAMVVDTVRRWGTEQHARVFHLGGGVGAAADSLFQFKAGFSKRRHEFSTWRWIIAPEIYQELTAERERWNAAHGLEAISSEFFPAYRCAGIARRDLDGAERATTTTAPDPALAVHHG